MEGEGEAIRNLFSPPIARIQEYRVTEVVTCAYTFTEDERFLRMREGKALVVSACSGHGYKFGAAVGRRVAAAVGEWRYGGAETLASRGSALQDVCRRGCWDATSAAVRPCTRRMPHPIYGKPLSSTILPPLRSPGAGIPA